MVQIMGEPKILVIYDIPKTQKILKYFRISEKFNMILGIVLSVPIGYYEDKFF